LLPIRSLRSIHAVQGRPAPRRPAAYLPATGHNLLLAGFNMLPMPPSPLKPAEDQAQAEAVQAKQRSFAARQASIKQFFSATSDF
jgi:hypothetical protein